MARWHARSVTRRRQPDARATYLRDLGGHVDRALALVVHDLVATKAIARDRAEAAVRIRAEEHLEIVQSNGFPVSAQETAVWVAEAVQEDLIEGRGDERQLVVWPRCPDHPNHPLWLRPRTAPDGSSVVDGDETWTCITTHRSIAELGQL